MFIKRKRIYVFISTALLCLILLKVFSSLLTYKNSFNLSVYNTMMKIKSHSDSIANYTKKISNGEYTQSNLFNLDFNYHEALQDIQQLNYSAYRFNENIGLNTEKIPTINFYILENRNELNFSKNEINELDDLNKIFSRLAEIIDLHTSNLSNDSWDNPNILKDGSWLKIIKDFNN